MSTCVVPRAVKQVLDVPAERLAAVIGAWPQPALLESGPHFGDAGHYQHPDGLSALCLGSDRGELVFTHRSAGRPSAVKETSCRSWGRC